MMDKLSDYIVVTEPLLSKETSSEILAVTEGIEWRRPEIYKGIERTCMSFPVSSACVGNYPVPEGRLDRVKWADQTLLSAAQKALRIYQKRHPRVYTRSDSGFDILRYEKGQFIGDHADDNVPRVLSMSVALNDDYTGGDFMFWSKQVIRVPDGCAIMFPPNFMYPHEILPVVSGTRYSMITWFI
jgi:hypothetical protein